MGRSKGGGFEGGGPEGVGFEVGGFDGGEAGETGGASRYQADLASLATETRSKTGGKELMTTLISSTAETMERRGDVVVELSNTGDWDPKDEDRGPKGGIRQQERDEGNHDRCHEELNSRSLARSKTSCGAQAGSAKSVGVGSRDGGCRKKETFWRKPGILYSVQRKGVNVNSRVLSQRCPPHWTPVLLPPPSPPGLQPSPRTRSSLVWVRDRSGGAPNSSAIASSLEPGA